MEKTHSKLCPRSGGYTDCCCSNPMEPLKNRPICAIPECRIPEHKHSWVRGATPTTAQRNRAIKKALVQKYGKSVSLLGGRGTAHGWIHIKITLPLPSGHVHDTLNYGQYCRACNEASREESKTVSAICHATAKEIGSYIGSFCSDDGYNTDRDEVLIYVDYK